jgi:histone deacetylase 6
MMQVPMMTPELEGRFSSQVMCTPDIFENKTLVVFVHEFGNLRLELESSATCDVQLERSYLIDFSKELVAWVRKEGYALLDANLYPKPSTTIQLRHKSFEDVGRDIMTYLWDNYIQLSSAQSVVLIGHGPGCRPLIDLVNRRAMTVTKFVKAFIQVIGLQKMPSFPADLEDARVWYQNCSLVIVPSAHPMMSPLVKPKDIRRHGTILPIEETRQIKLIAQGLPAIKQFVNEELSKSPLSNGTNRIP